MVFIKLAEESIWNVLSNIVM